MFVFMCGFIRVTIEPGNMSVFTTVTEFLILEWMSFLSGDMLVVLKLL